MGQNKEQLHIRTSSNRRVHIHTRHTHAHVPLLISEEVGSRVHEVANDCSHPAASLRLEHLGLHGASLGKCPKRPVSKKSVDSPVQVRQEIMEISVWLYYKSWMASWPVNFSYPTPKRLPSKVCSV